MVISALVCSGASCRKFVTKTIGAGSPSSARTTGGWSIISSSETTAKQVFFMTFSFAPLVHVRSVSYDRPADATKTRATVVTRAELEQQLEELHPASFTWALALCGRDAEDARDVLQETYLKIFE